MAKSKRGERVISTNADRSFLKKKVYSLSAVSTTKALKACRSEFSKLDFRRTASWEKALVYLEKDNSSSSLEQLCANPSDKYRELFADITQSFKNSQVLIEKSDLLVKRLGDNAAALEELVSDGDKD